MEAYSLFNSSPDTYEEITDMMASGLTYVVFSNKVYVYITK